MQIWFQSKIKTRLANSVDPDETAHYEPSHLDLHCLQRYARLTKLNNSRYVGRNRKSLILSAVTQSIKNVCANMYTRLICVALFLIRCTVFAKMMTNTRALSQ